MGVSRQEVFHWFNAVPYSESGTELECYLDGPAAEFRYGCGCGWRSPKPIAVTRKDTYELPDDDWGRAAAEWQSMHHAPAVLDDLDFPVPVVVAPMSTGPMPVSDYRLRARMR